jgi:hypothetical protein
MMCVNMRTRCNKPAIIGSEFRLIGGVNCLSLPTNVACTGGASYRPYWAMASPCLRALHGHSRRQRPAAACGSSARSQQQHAVAAPGAGTRGQQWHAASNGMKLFITIELPPFTSTLAPPLVAWIALLWLWQWPFLSSLEQCPGSSEKHKIRLGPCLDHKVWSQNLHSKCPVTL